MRKVLYSDIPELKSGYDQDTKRLVSIVGLVLVACSFLACLAIALKPLLAGM